MIETNFKDENILASIKNGDDGCINPTKICLMIINSNYAKPTKERC